MKNHFREPGPGSGGPPGPPGPPGPGGRAVGSPAFVVAVAVVLGLGYLALRPALLRARDGARRARSSCNLKQIGLALAMYAQEHDGALPAALDELVDTGYVTDPAILVSPRTGGSYTYIRPPDGVFFTSESPDEVAVACDRGTDRKGQGGNVLCLDGHVTWWAGPDPVESGRQAAGRAAAGAESGAP